jgi:DNA polymerase phi
MANKTLKVLNTRASEDQESRIQILEAITCDTNNWAFDKFSKTKTIEKLIGLTYLNQMDKIVNILTDKFRCTEFPAKDHHRIKQEIADLFLTLLRCSKLPKEDDKLIEYRKTGGKILETLTDSAFLRQETRSDDEKASGIREMLRGKVMSCLTHLIAKDPESSQHSITVANLLIKAPKQRYTAPISHADTKVLKALDQAAQVLEEILKTAQKFKSSDSEPKLYNAIGLLFSLAIIQAFSGEADAIDTLEDLQGCYKSMFIANQPKNAVSSTFVEIILSLVAKPSQLFRRISREIFSACTSIINHDGLMRMVEVMQVKESIVGQQELFEQEDEEMVDATEDEESDTSDASDVEEIDDDDSESDGEDSDSDQSSPGEDEQELNEFEKKLAEALGTRRADIDRAISEAESSDEDMNDEQMTALDPVMANLFKEQQKSNTKKDKKNARENVIQMKSKVLELLEVYVQQQTENPIALDLICPLLMHIRSTTSKQISEKACSILKGFLNAYKLKIEINTNQAELTNACHLLHNVHDLLAIGGSKAYMHACSQSSLLLAKVVSNSGGSIETHVWPEYSRTMVTMINDPKNRPLPLVYIDFCNWLSSAKTVFHKRR